MKGLTIRNIILHAHFLNVSSDVKPLSLTHSL